MGDRTQPMGGRSGRSVVVGAGFAAALALTLALMVAIVDAGAQTGCGGFAGRIELVDGPRVNAGVPGSILPVAALGVSRFDVSAGSNGVQVVTNANGEFCLPGEAGDHELRFDLGESDRHRFAIEAPNVDGNAAAIEFTIPIVAADYNSPAVVPVQFRYDVVEVGTTIRPAWRVRVGGQARAAKIGTVSTTLDVASGMNALMIHTTTRAYLDWWETTFDEPIFETFPTAPGDDPLGVLIASDGTHYRSRSVANSSPGEVQIAAADSNYTDRHQSLFMGGGEIETTEWHELTHYTTDLDGLYDSNVPGINHGGWLNPNSRDSMTEGWAAFVPAVAGREVAGIRADDAYGLFGSLDTNDWRAYSRDSTADGRSIHREDMAVASLLWDLYDGTPGGDGLTDCTQIDAGCDSSVRTIRPVRDHSTFDAAVSLEDRVSIPIETLYEAMIEIEGDLTVAAFSDQLHARPGIDPALKDRSAVELARWNDPVTGTEKVWTVSPIDATFLLHSFHPCDIAANPDCFPVFGDPIGRSDHVPDGNGGLLERRAVPVEPGAAIRLINEEAEAAKVVIQALDSDGIVTRFERLIAPGEQATVPLTLPPYSSVPTLDGPLPDCTTVNNALSTITLIDETVGGSSLGGALNFDSCEFAALIAASDGQPAVTYLVGDATLRYQVEFVDFAHKDEAGVITVDQTLSFADLETAVSAHNVSLNGSSLVIDGVLRLYVPALEALAPARIPGAILELSGASSTNGLEAFAARLRGQIVYGSEILDVDLGAAFADTGGNPLESFDLRLDLTGADGDRVIDSAELVQLLGELGESGSSDFADFGSALPEVSLESLHASVHWTPAALTADLDARATIDELGVAVLLSLDDTPADDDARFLIGARFDNATDPTSEISLDGFLGGSLGTLAAGIELPEFALGTAFGGGPVTNADLRPSQRAFFCGCAESALGPDDGLPDGLDLGGTLSLAAKINVDAFDGTGARQLFGYDRGATVDLTGTLGFTLADLDGGLGLSVDDVDLSAEFPSFTGANAAALPDWLDVLDPTIRLKVAIDPDTTDRSVVVEFAARADVTVDEETLPFAVTVGVKVQGDRTTFSFSGATPTVPDELIWDSPFGLDWLMIDDFGISAKVILENGEVTVEGGLTASFSLAEKNFEVAIDFASSAESASVTVRVGLDDTISLDEVLGLFGSPEVPDQLGGITVGPVDIVARFGTEGAGLTVTAQGAVPVTQDLTLTGQLLFSLSSDGQGGYDVIFGVRSDGITLEELFGADPLGLGELPPIGLIGTTDAFSGTRATLSVEEAEFYGPLFGCPVPGDTACQFEVELNSGIHLVSTVAIPGDPDDDTTDLADIVKLVWVDPAKGVLLHASAPLPGSGSIDLTSFSLRLQLGINPPNDVRADFVWFDSASLAIEIDGPSIAIAGGLGIKLGREDRTDQATCAAEPRAAVWKESYPGSGVSACYDLLDLELSAAIAFDGPPKLKFTGSLLTSGWYPVDFLRVDAAKLQIGVELAGPPVFTFGFLAQGGIQFGEIGKDFMGSAVIGLRTLPNAPFVVPEPKGLHIASQAGIELADIPKLYDYVVETAERIAAETGTTVEALLGIDPPTSAELGLDPATLPNVSLRNIELMFGIGSYPELCIEPGLIIGGELLINAEPLAVIPNALPIGDKCADVGPLSDPTECAAKPECFASVSLRVTLDGIVVSGALGSVDLGLIRCDESLLDLRLTLETQRFLLSGGCDALIPSFDPNVPPTVLASGDLSFSLGLDGISFLGDLQIFPEPPPPGFRILVEGQAALDLASIDFSDPNALQAIDFDFHALLQADFGAEVDDTVVAVLDDLRLAAQLVDELWADFRDSGGDPLEALINLPNTLRELGEPVPAWVDGFSDGLADFRDSLEQYDIDLPNLDDILGGYSFEYSLIGVEVLGGCYTLWVVPGTVVDGVCYSIAPGTESLPGVCVLVPGAPCSVVEMEQMVSDLLKPVLTDIAGVPADQDVTLTTLLAAITANIEPGGALFRLDCVDFRITTLDEADSFVALRVKAEVLGNPVNFTLVWDLNADPLAEAARFAEQLVAQVFGDPQPVMCEALGTTTVGLPTVGSATPEPPTLSDFDLSVSPSVQENGTATAEIEFNIAPPSPVDVTIDWEDGPAQVVSVSTRTATFTHRYLDDDPTATASDTYDVTVSAIGRTKRSGLTVRNAAPTEVALSTTGANEGGVGHVSGTFVDVGSLDTHRVRIDWGDGSTSALVDLPSGARSFSFDHTYVDDDPSKTPADDYVVKVTVLDDDRGRGVGVENLRVTNVAPSGTTFAPTGDIDEGAVAGFSVAFVDPGVDTHTVRVDWGDGTPSEVVALPGGQRSFTAAHVFVDDDPSGTPSDQYTVAVTLTDDDTGSFTSTFDVVVRNVAPVIVGGPAPSDTPFAINGTVDSADDVVDEDGFASVTVDFTDPGLRDVHEVVIDWGDGTTTTAVPELGARQAERSHRYLDDDPTATAQDTYTISVALGDDDTGSDSASATLLVRDVAPEVSTDTATQQVQYSDPGETIMVTATDVERDTLTAEVWFDEGDTATTPGLPSWLELSDDGDCATDGPSNLRTCEWTLTPVPDPVAGIYTDADPGTYTVRVRITDDDTLFTDLAATIIVLPEDARAFYIGPTYAATDDFRDNSTTIELRATIQDITLAVDDPDWDPYPGDVLKATTRFVDREASDAVLCHATLGYTFSGEIGLATAVCDWEADIGRGDADDWIIGTVAGGRYVRNQTDDDTIVLVARPIDQSINGGGFLVMSDSDGAYPADAGSNANFGFTVKFNKKGTNLQGHVTVIVRADGRVYRIKTNALTSLGVAEIDGDGNGVAQFEAKANLTDVTDEAAPESVGGNLTLQMRMTDLGEPGDADTIGFSLWGRDGELLFSSDWDDVQTVEQTLGGGNLTVRP